MSLHQQAKAESGSTSERWPQLKDFTRAPWACEGEFMANVEERRPETIWVECGRRSCHSTPLWTSAGFCHRNSADRRRLLQPEGSDGRRQQRGALTDFQSPSQVLQLPLTGIAQSLTSAVTTANNQAAAIPVLLLTVKSQFILPCIIKQTNKPLFLLLQQNWFQMLRKYSSTHYWT